MADKLRIVIAQTYQESIDALKDALSGVRRHAISYTQDPREALALAGHSKTVLLVTGQYF